MSLNNFFTPPPGRDQLIVAIGQDLISAASESFRPERRPELICPPPRGWWRGGLPIHKKDCSSFLMGYAELVADKSFQLKAGEKCVKVGTLGRVLKVRLHLLEQK